MKGITLITDKEYLSNRDFRIETIETNLYRGKLLAIVIIVLETVLSLVDIISYLLGADSRFQFGGYLSMYAIMIGANAIYLLWINSIKNMPEKSKPQLKRIESVIVVFVIFSMCWGSIVTLMDQRLYGQLASYMINVLACSVIYSLTIKQVTIPIAASSLILYVGLPFFQGSSDILIGHYVNLTIFMVISWVASRIVFQSHYNYFTSKLQLNNSKVQLEAETRINAKNNEKLKELNQHLKRLSLLDDLTRLPNRRSFRDYIDYHFDYLQEKPTQFSVIMIDVDHFKQLNDKFGHSIGDSILKRIAKQINASINIETDFAARWGGDEFIYASFSHSREETLKIAHSMQKNIIALNRSVTSAIKPPDISVSLGACTLPVMGKETISRCIECADKALYEAKSSGRNCVRSFNLQFESNN